MSIMEPNIALPRTWSDVRGRGPEKDRQREALEAELALELSVGHVLHGRAFSIVARSEANDDILIALDDDKTWAMVHLTWRGTGERPPWPKTLVFPALADAIAAIQQ